MPEEVLEPGDEGKCGRLKMSMYGTRDAALNWSLEYASTLLASGYVQGKANPCLFHNAAIGVSVMVHGDEFVAVEDKLKDTQKTLEQKYKIKTEKLGQGDGCKSEIRILNKVLRATSEGIELEADPRHAELVVKELGLDNAKASLVPGSQGEVKKVGKLNNVDSVQKARVSAGGDT